MEHSFHSPVFWLFPKVKFVIKGGIFHDIKRHRKNVTTALKAIPQQEFFPEVFPAVTAPLG
jgi:hypothetical protein